MNASCGRPLSSNYIPMKNFLFSLAILFALIGAAHVYSFGQTVSGSFANSTVAKGSRVRGTVVLNVPAGLHVNSSRPSSEYLIPTTVRLAGNGVRVGGVTYPRGKNRKFQFSESLLNIYDGTVRFPFTVTVPANYKGKTISVKATVRYQACTDEVCYPPRTGTATITARVR
jgi:DsbC/DsbD-like thiol-disulfide interchange protein